MADKPSIFSTEKLLQYSLIGIILFFLIVSGYLFYLNKTRLYTYNEVKYDIPMNKSVFRSLIVYQLQYLNQSGNDWTFINGVESDLSKLVRDYESNDINMIYFNQKMYEIKNITQACSEKFIFTLESQCYTSLPFFQCVDNGDSLSKGNVATTVLQVIGFKMQ